MSAGLTRLQLNTLTGPDPQQYDDMLHSMSELQHLQIHKVTTVPSHPELEVTADGFCQPCCMIAQGKSKCCRQEHAHIIHSTMAVSCPI